MASVTWDEVLALPAWPSLSAIAPHAVLMKANLMKAGAHQYVVVASYDRELREGSPQAPFVTSAIWAPSDGAALRCGLQEVQEDDATSLSVEPPMELVPFGQIPTYAKITEAARTGRYGVYLEHAEYRVTTSGGAEFVHKVVEVGRIGYCFRSSTKRDRELPYAVRVSLLMAF
jgi:hypothetical protein